MRRSRQVRRLDWERLEGRDCPSRGLAPALDPDLPALIPTPRTDVGLQMLANAYAAEAAKGSPNVVFFGDSYMYNFQFQDGEQSWAQKIAPLGAESYGVGGDQTGNLLWRLETGELVNPPKVAVVEVGANNLGSAGNFEPPAEVAAGIIKVVQTIRAYAPRTKILLLGVPPVGGAKNVLRGAEAAVNGTTSHVANGQNIVFFDPGKVLIEPDGSIAANYESNLVHLNPNGYALLANAVAPILQRMLGQSARPALMPQHLR